MAKYAESIVKENSKLELLVSRQSFTVCFRYISDTETDLNKFNLELRESLRKSGKSIVNYGFIDNILTIRLITANGEIEKSDIDLFFKNIIGQACKIEKKPVLDYA